MQQAGTSTPVLQDHTLSIVEQVTRHKLKYVQQLLASANLPKTGTRAKLRDRLTRAIRCGVIPLRDVQVLLDELDAWGNQRIRLLRLPVVSVAGLNSGEVLSRRARGAGMADLLDADVMITPPEALTPMSVSLIQGIGGHRLKLVAAKTRTFVEPIPDIADHVDRDKHPEVIFKPFRQERQKAVVFAEINLSSGLVVLSTALFHRQPDYQAEFNQFFDLFDALIPLHDAEPVHLYGANRRIPELSQSEVTLVARRARTRSGSMIRYRSCSSRADMRVDPDLNRSQAALPDATGLHCNCFWEPIDSLEERVHTYVFASEAEISIHGQVREASAQYVLRRIQEVN